MQQYAADRSGKRTPESEIRALGLTRRPEADSTEAGLAMPWAGALSSSHDHDDTAVVDTAVVASPYGPPAEPDGTGERRDLDRVGEPRGVRRRTDAHVESISGGAGSGAPPDWGTTTLRLGPRLAAGLSYLLWWISGLVVYFNERENRYVRFHAVQAILLTSVLTIGGVIAYIISSLLGDAYANTHQLAFRHLSIGVGLLAAFGILILWLAPMIAAWSGEYLRLPILGRYAERFAAVPTRHSDV